jgi:hypothetical protein
MAEWEIKTCLLDDSSFLRISRFGLCWSYGKASYQTYYHATYFQVEKKGATNDQSRRSTEVFGNLSEDQKGALGHLQ